MNESENSPQVQAETARVRSAGHAIAAVMGYSRAAQLLRQIAEELAAMDWRGPGTADALASPVDQS